MLAGDIPHVSMANCRDGDAVLSFNDGESLGFIPGRQPYTRWITGNASSIVVIENTSNSIHGVYFMVSS